MSSIDGLRFNTALGGTVISFADIIKKNPDAVFKLSDAQVAEVALHDSQVAARQAAATRAAAANPDQVFAQIVKDGKVVAMVYDSGTAFSEHEVALSEGYAGPSLADKRLAELMRSVPGTVIYDHFIPLPGQRDANDIKSSSRVDEALLPKVTARSLSDILAEVTQARAATRNAAAAADAAAAAAAATAAAAAADKAA